MSTILVMNNYFFGLNNSLEKLLIQRYPFFYYSIFGSCQYVHIWMVCQFVYVMIWHPNIQIVKTLNTKCFRFRFLNGSNFFIGRHFGFTILKIDVYFQFLNGRDFPLENWTNFKLWTIQISDMFSMWIPTVCLDIHISRHFSNKKIYDETNITSKGFYDNP